MAHTGKQRSLTVVIGKTVAGENQAGYPKTYYGRNEFTHNSVTYPVIDTLKMATMPIDDYTARLAAFKAYVESQEAGLVVADVVTETAYRENLTACPIN